MPLLHFEVLKPKITFQLDVPSNYTFFQLSELIFIHFNIDKNTFPDGKDLKLSFIYKCISCRYEKTIESYQIDPQAKIYISIPKQLSQTFSKAMKANVPVNSNSSYPKNMTNNAAQQNSNIMDSNQNPQTSTDSISMVLNYVNKAHLKQLMSYGYNKIDSAYALAYRNTLGASLDFLYTGLASDPQAMEQINKLVSLTISNRTDEALRYKLEVAKMESNKRGEIPEVNMAATASVYAIKPGIKNQDLLLKIKDYAFKIKEKYPNETAIKAQKLLAEEFSNQKKNQNPLQALFNMQGQNQGQFQQMLQQNLMNTYNVQQTKNKFWNIFNSLPSKTPQNYLNPFIETADEVLNVKHSPVDDFFYSYGKTLNYEQLMFLYRAFKERGIEIHTSMQYLNASNGNINDAQALLNGI